MSIKKKLQILLRYYDNSRQSGHTHTMIHGVKNNDNPVIVVTHNLDMEKHIKTYIGDKKVIIIPIDFIDKELVFRKDTPMVFDNAALWVLLRDAARQIEVLEDDLQIYSDKLQDIADVLNR